MICRYWAPVHRACHPHWDDICDRSLHRRSNARRIVVWITRFVSYTKTSYSQTRRLVSAGRSAKGPLWWSQGRRRRRPVCTASAYRRLRAHCTKNLGVGRERVARAVVRRTSSRAANCRRPGAARNREKYTKTRMNEKLKKNAVEVPPPKVAWHESLRVTPPRPTPRYGRETFSRARCTRSSNELTNYYYYYYFNSIGKSSRTEFRFLAISFCFLYEKKKMQCSWIGGWTGDGVVPLIIKKKKKILAFSFWFFIMQTRNGGGER